MAGQPITDVRIRHDLSRVWSAFFSRWGRLTAIQRMAIPLILHGENLLVIAPTASGKTEAVMAPLMELSLRDAWPSGSILYVTPTRALVNDIHQRLQPLLHRLGRTLGRRTADHHEVRDDRWPDVVLVTPESLDSILCRFPSRLESLHAVVMDELHLIDGTARGDQLRGLLYRLNRLLGDRAARLRRFGLSATIAAPEAVGRRYLGDCFRIARVPHQRWAEPVGFWPYETDETAADRVAEILQAHKFRKVLLFVNAKAHAEKMAALLKDRWGYPQRVFVHHGRLSRRVRLDVEQAFHAAPVGICIATTTLEVGVDIGGVDAVGLLAVPPTFASFLQRFGRGSRKSAAVPVFGFYRHEVERAILEVYLELVNRADIPVGAYAALPAAAVQQMLSYVLQKRRVGCSMNSLSALWHALVGDEDPDATPALEHLIARLIDKEWLQERHRVFTPGPRLMEAFQRGWIHSTIEDIPGLLQVVDEQGRTLAELHWETALPPGGTLQIGGRRYQIVRLRGHTMHVRRTPDRAPATATPFPTAPPVFWTHALGRRVVLRLFPGLGEHHIPVWTEGPVLHVVHGFGYVHALIWSRTLARVQGWKVAHSDALYTRFEDVNQWPDTWVPPEDAIRKELQRLQGSLERWFGVDRYYRLLDGAGRQWHLRRALRWSNFRAFLENCVFIQMDDSLPFSAQ